MTITKISTDKFLADTIIFIRDDLLNNITDPNSSARSGRDSKFVLTEYPNRDAIYPLITVVDDNSSFKRLGMRSTQMMGDIRIEIRVWARTVAERDEITQEVINWLRVNQFSGSSYSDAAGLHDFEVYSAVNVNEGGPQGIKSKVITIGNMIILE